MAAHRYWRLLLGRRSGVAALVTEIAMATSIGGANACTGGTATSSAGGTGVAANAFDADTGTSWASAAADPAHINYDFGAGNEKAIVEVAVTIGATAGTTPYYFIIQYSDDNSRWTSLATYDISGAAVSSTTTVNGFPTVLANARLPTAFLRMNTFWPTTPLRGRPYPGRHLKNDTLSGGKYQITGTVKVDSTPDYPVHRRVRLHRVSDGAPIREVWSDETTGAYTFNYLAYQRYFVVAHDYTDTFNAVVKDAVLPELMP